MKKKTPFNICISFDGKIRLILYSRVKYFTPTLKKLVSCEKWNIFLFFISKQRFGHAYIFQYYTMHYLYFYVVSIVVFFLYLNLNCDGFYHCLEPGKHIRWWELKWEKNWIFTKWNYGWLCLGKFKIYIFLSNLMTII